MKHKMIPMPKCFKCKLSLEIYKEENNEDIIYFDKHYFHKECFGNMQEIKKKCFFCKKDINITDINLNETVLYENHFYHNNCFEKWCYDTKRPSKKRLDALKYINLYSDCANQEIEKIKTDKHYQTETELRNNTNKQISDWFIGSELCSFIKEQYDISNVPWNMIKDVINGTSYKNDFPIPVEHLYDMWKKKIELLNKTYSKNKSIGKTMNDYQRISYDLSILVNKYDSYKKWLEKQRILKIEEQINKTDNIITSNFIIHTQEKIDNSDDISNLVDDIFGDD